MPATSTSASEEPMASPRRRLLLRLVGASPSSGSGVAFSVFDMLGSPLAGRAPPCD
jgi:hypothetical protein